jgi:hypothetical protein
MRPKACNNSIRKNVYQDTNKKASTSANWRMRSFCMRPAPVLSTTLDGQNWGWVKLFFIFINSSYFAQGLIVKKEIIPSTKA